MFKKLVSVLTCSLIIITSQIPVFAASKPVDPNGGIHPKYRIECMDSPDQKHHMYTRGMGTIVNQDNIVLVGSGYAYQCKYCNTAVISEYNAVDYKLGNFAVWNAPSRLSINGTFLKINDDDLSYKSTNRLSGFLFYYS